MQIAFYGSVRKYTITSLFGKYAFFSRFIFDVNIDTFEEKPWRYPGVDVTDFFNFGFNEDSWKQYCDSLVNKFNVVLSS